MGRCDIEEVESEADDQIFDSGYKRFALNLSKFSQNVDYDSF